MALPWMSRAVFRLRQGARSIRVLPIKLQNPFLHDLHAPHSAEQNEGRKRDQKVRKHPDPFEEFDVQNGQS